jgi:hydrogenase-4 component E
MTIDPVAAARLVDTCAAAIVLVGILIAGTRSIGRSIWLVGLQAVLLGIAGIGVGLATGSSNLIVGGLFTGIVKGAVVPVILGRILRQSRVRVERHPLIGPRVSLLVAILIVFAATAAVDGAALRGSLGAPTALPVAVAEILTGLLITMSRRKGLSIIVGLLVFENGLALTAFSLTYGMPLVIEFGVLFDLLIAIVAVWVYARRMLTVLGTMDTDELRSLRG